MSAPVIMWFRQDLRLADNSALAAAAAAGPVIPVFVLDDETPGDWRWGGASRWWLHRSLAALSGAVPLVLRRGRADLLLEEVIAASGAGAVYFARDYAPWSAALEERVKAACEKQGAACHRYGGYLLHEPEAVRTGAGGPFKVYSPFARACFARGEPKPPRPAPEASWASHGLASDALAGWKLLPTKPDWATGFETAWQPGEAGAQAKLAEFLDEALPGYADGRDRPDSVSTSRLSPHLHWGEISPAQIWHAVRHKAAAAGGRLDRDAEKYLKEVLWREFSYHLIHHFPHMLREPFRPEFAAMPWRTDAAALKRWQKGETGYPIVDAGLRELWATGYMHNRVRMIAASLLVKHLLIDWREGERWFWDTLVDADIGNNTASWQWVAGSGADAAPYFRIFNPVLQGVKFDPAGDYVKRWVPELRGVPVEFIHTPWEMASPPASYPAPIVEHGLARERALAAFAAIGKEYSA
jgi:deoxyribodipyrimidine photo-lyase